MLTLRPRHLQIFLSNRCNLSCSYCYVAVNKGPALKLDFRKIAGALDTLLEDGSPAPRRLSFLGGEPLLQLPVVLKTVAYARRKAAGPLAVNLYTNGTRLSAATLGALEKLGVFTILSLDGKKRANDRHRKFAKGAASVFDEVMERVAPLPKRQMGVNMVITPDNVSGLTDGVDFFYRRGFRSINFYPDVYGIYSARRLAQLRKEMNRFCDYYAGLFAPGGEPFTIPSLASVLQRQSPLADAAWWRSCDKLVLGADGRYHACDKAMSEEPARMDRSAVGSASAGPDWRARDAHFGRARKAIAAAPAQRYSFCPMGSFFHASWSGQDAGPLMDSFRQVDRIYTASFLALKRRLEGSASFQRAYASSLSGG